MVQAYWEIGRSIVEEQGGEERAEYGNALIINLSEKLTADYGKGFDERNSFYEAFLHDIPNSERVAFRIGMDALSAAMQG